MQADPEVEVEVQQPKKRTFKKFTFRGVDLDALLDMSSDELVELFHARARRRSAALSLPRPLTCQAILIQSSIHFF